MQAINEFIWNAEPNEEDFEHAHAFDTDLLILEGEIEIKMDKASAVLKKDDRIHIPKNKIHYAKAGAKGCKYKVIQY